MRPVDDGRVPPEPLEVVVLALLGPEDVHDDVDVVEQPPPGVGLPLADAEGASDLGADVGAVAVPPAGEQRSVNVRDFRLKCSAEP